MKTKIISFLMLVNSIFLYAQLETTHPVQITDKQKIEELLQNLSLACKYNIKPLFEQLVKNAEPVDKESNKKRISAVNDFDFAIKEFSNLEIKLTDIIYSENDKYAEIKVSASIFYEGKNSKF